MLFVHQFFQSAVDDVFRLSFGCSWGYPYHSSLCTDDCEHGGETMDGSYFLKCKFRVNQFSWLKVTGVNFYIVLCVFYYYNVLVGRLGFYYGTLFS